MLLIGILLPESIRNVVRNAWNAALKAREEHIQAKNSKRSDGVRGIVDNDTHRRTAKMLVTELVGVLYPCLSDVQLYRPTNVVEMAKNKIDMIRIIHSCRDRILKMPLHIG